MVFLNKRLRTEQNMQGDRFYETIPEWEPVKENREAPPPSENPQPSTSPKKGRLLRSTTTLSSSSKSDEGIQDQITNPIDGPSQQHEDFLQIEGEESISVLPIEPLLYKGLLESFQEKKKKDLSAFPRVGEIFLKRTATGAY